MADDTRDTDTGDEAILKECRERWEYAYGEWQDIKAEGAIDIRYVAGDVWDPKDRALRLKAGRPCISMDELSQYVNQLNNEVRQNKRAIKVTPMGNGANDASARLKEDLIRQIEYRSNAQMAYTTMFENTVQRSYGFLQIVPHHIEPTSGAKADQFNFDQELIIEPIVNPDLVTPDPDALKPNGSDMRYCFVRESRSREEFKREFPKAKIRDFDSTAMKQAAGWVTDQRVFIANYWTLETRKRELLLLNTTEGPKKYFADELASKPSKANILKSREVDDTTVMKYLTNGLEILSKTEWPGQSIPIVCCYGKVLYVEAADVGGEGAKRRLMSLIRLARDPAMYYAYLRTSQAEVIGKVPRTPAIGYTGQFRGHETDWQKAAHEPVAYLEANPTTDATGAQVLPLPQQFPGSAPELAGLEVLAEGARRGVQSAIGQSPLPTSAQRRNEKSGVALKQIEDTSQKGSFHFIDHYDEAITRTGAILVDLLPHFYDTARDVTIRTEDDNPKVVRINDPGNPEGLDDKQQPRVMDSAPYDVTLSTGPKKDSEREAANELSTQLIEQLPMIAQVSGPKVAAKLFSLAIKNRNVGAMGDLMADTVSPPEEKDGGPQVPPEIIAKLQEQEQMLAQAKQMIETDQAKQQATIQKAQIDAQADQQKAAIDAEVRVKIATIQAETQIAVAQIKAAEDGVEARLKHLEDIMGHKADFLMQQREQAHQTDMGQMQHAQAVDEGERWHQQDMESGEMGHQQKMEQGDQSGELAERQIEKQAEVAPQPEA